MGIVLIGERNNVAADIMKHKLAEERHGCVIVYDTTSATRYIGGIRQHKQDNPNIQGLEAVILNIRLPKGDPIALAYHLYDMDPKIPIALVSRPIVDNARPQINLFQGPDYELDAAQYIIAELAKKQ